MRQLNEKQKNILKHKFDLAPSNQKPTSVQDISGDWFKPFCELNDHETIVQNADRFLWDLYCDWLNKQDTTFMRYGW